MKKPKLELTWIGKENRPRLEPRILLETPEYSHHAAQRQSENDEFDNILIKGDNLLALKALEQEYSGKVKCVFIDPPYNTGSAFTHYDDGVEHSLWLSLMRDRLELIRTLLAADGSLWITIDDNEAHYLKVLCDEVFGRNNFVVNMVWNHRKSVQNDIVISLSHNHVLVIAKDKSSVQLNRSSVDSDKYSNPDDDERGDWYATPFDAPNIRPNLTYGITNPNTGEEYWPPAGRHWRTGEKEYLKLLADNRIIFGKTGKAKPQQKLFLSDSQDKGSSVKTWWDDAGTATEATKELQKLELNFDTPKPERLLQRVLEIATNPGDLVLDSFAGSGTTGAVAHKMGRRWIMVELGEHCYSHIVPRLKKVIDGQDAGGISGAVNWKGGGGFRAYTLAPSLLERDRWDRWIINRQYNAAMLSQALCKLEGFTYAPSETLYWQQGFSTERDFLYVTTCNLSPPQLRALSDEVGTGSTLLVLCGAFRGSADAYENLTIKKIPQAVLQRCEWGHDDYSLQVENLPQAPKNNLFD